MNENLKEAKDYLRTILSVMQARIRVEKHQTTLDNSKKQCIQAEAAMTMARKYLEKRLRD